MQEHPEKVTIQPAYTAGISKDPIHAKKESNQQIQFGLGCEQPPEKNRPWKRHFAKVTRRLSIPLGKIECFHDNSRCFFES